MSCLTCRHTFAHSQSSQIGVENGRSQHLEQALQTPITESGSHAEASKRAGTAYLNMHKAHTFDLTHKTGSFMYMAPEVFTDRMYNEKVQISFFFPENDVIMLSLMLHRSSIQYIAFDVQHSD